MCTVHGSPCHCCSNMLITFQCVSMYDAFPFSFSESSYKRSMVSAATQPMASRPNDIAIVLRVLNWSPKIALSFRMRALVWQFANTVVLSLCVLFYLHKMPRFIYVIFMPAIAIVCSLSILYSLQSELLQVAQLFINHLSMGLQRHWAQLYQLSRMSLEPYWHFYRTILIL